MNNSYKIEKLKTELYLTNRFNKCNSSLALYIYDNLNKIKYDDIELNKLAAKIISPIQSIKLLTEYELLNYQPETKFDKIDELVKFTLINIKKFQGIIGGYDIEDTEWLINKDRFRISNKNQKVIYNTTEQKNNNAVNNNFVSLYIDYLKRFVNENIKIKYKFIDDDKNEICWIVIIFEECDIMC
jgi:hypothetical protein